MTRLLFVAVLFAVLVATLPLDYQCCEAKDHQSTPTAPKKAEDA